MFLKKLKSLPGYRTARGFTHELSGILLYSGIPAGAVSSRTTMPFFWT
jgi:hypothetical protein